MLGEIRISAFGLYWPKLVRQLREYDVVNLHGPVPTMSDVFLFFNRALPRTRRPPVVYTHHSAIDIEGLGPPCALYNNVHGALARTADRIVVTSNAYRDLLATSGGPPVDVVPWGVDSVDGTGTLLARQRRDHLRILFVGQMRPYKGVDTLLRAVARQPALALTLVGSGPLLDRYRALATALGATNVTFAGKVDDAELRAHYRSHDVVALPSTTRAEAFGLVLLEGMASGCVPVASDLPGVRDVASPTGFVVSPRDPQALRQVLVSLAADPERLRQLQHASRLAAADMAWERTVDGYERAFARTVGDWCATQAEILLPEPWAGGKLTLASLVEEFDASWASLLLFGRRPAQQLLAAWGRANLAELRRDPPRISGYVARTGRPQLLDRDCSDSVLSGLLRRTDVYSAMSVPFRCRTGMTAVLNLSLANDERRVFEPWDLERLMLRISGGLNGHRHPVLSQAAFVAFKSTGL
jgi:rhamnosyl/mannosyltransferase